MLDTVYFKPWCLVNNTVTREIYRDFRKTEALNDLLLDEFVNYSGYSYRTASQTCRLLFLIESESSFLCPRMTSVKDISPFIFIYVMVCRSVRERMTYTTVLPFTGFPLNTLHVIRLYIVWASTVCFSVSIQYQSMHHATPATKILRLIWQRCEREIRHCVILLLTSSKN